MLQVKISVHDFLMSVLKIIIYHVTVSTLFKILIAWTILETDALRTLVRGNSS